MWRCGAKWTFRQRAWMHSHPLGDARRPGRRRGDSDSGLSLASRTGSDAARRPASGLLEPRRHPPEGGAAGTFAMGGALLLEASTGTVHHRSSQANLGLERRRNQGGDAAIARPRITRCYMAEIGVKVTGAKVRASVALLRFPSEAIL